MFFFIICLVGVYSTKEGKAIPFSLKDGKTITLNLQLENPNLILYVRPPLESLEEEEQKLSKHHDEGNRLLKEQQSGILEFSIQGNEDDSWDHEITQYFQTTLFIAVQQTQQVILTCKVGPCKGTVTAYSQEGIKLTEELEEIQIKKSKPIQLLLITLPKEYNRSVGYIKILSDVERVMLELFNTEAVISSDELSLSFAIQKSEQESKRIYAIVSGETKLKKYFKIMAQIQVFQDITPITTSSIQQDFLFSGQINAYKLPLQQSYKTLSLVITSKMVPRILVNPKTEPSKIKDYLFDTQIQGDKMTSEFQLILTSDVLDADLIYIAITGIFGQYSLKITTLSTYPILYTNQFLMAFIKPDIQQKYYFKTPLLDEDNEVQISFKHFNSEEASKVTAALCNDLTNCAPSQSNTDEIRMLQDKTNPKIFIKPSCTQGDDDGLCTYILAVQESSSATPYSITSSLTIAQKKLKANSPWKNYIIEGEEQNLILQYQKQEGDTSLIFTVSTNNVVYMISKDPQCYPVRQDCAKYFGGADDIVVLRGHQLESAQFFISIVARWTSLYTFTAQTRNSQTLIAKKLKEDETFRGVLYPANPDEDIAYFQFEVDFDVKDNEIEVSDDTINPIIELNLHGSKYKLAMTLNIGDKLPSTEDFQMISLNNYLAIYPSDKVNYLRKGRYSVAIEFLFHDNYDVIDTDTKLHFSLTYSTSRTIKTLSLGQQYFDQIQPLGKKMYSFHHALNDNSLFISKSDFSKNKISLSVSGYVVREADEFVLQLEEHSSSLTISGDSLKRLCESEEPEDENVMILGLITCQAYVTIENHSGEACSYSVNVWSTEFPIEMHEGQMNSFNLENLFNGMRLYYNVVSYVNDAQLLISSYHGYTNYTIKIVNTKQQEEDLYFTESMKTQHSKSISSSAFEKCKPFCQIQIELQAQDEPFNIDNERIIEFDDMVSIIISQQFLEIYNGTPMQVTITEDQPRHFIYSGLKQIPSDSRLKLVLHEVFGKGAMCLSFSDDTYLRQPISSTNSCDYAVQGNVIELTKFQIQEILDKNNLIDNVVMIIELSTRNKGGMGKFLMSIEESNNINNHKLQLGSPVRLKMDIVESVSYQFYNFQNDSLHFKLIKLAGTIDITVTKCLDDVVKQCQIEQVFQDKLAGGQSYSHYTLQTNDTNYCSYCTYYFNFTTFGVSLDALFTVTTDKNFVQLSQGITFTDYLDNSNDMNLYHFSFDTNHQIEVNIKEYDGSTDTYLSFSQGFDVKDYQFGPYNTEKQQKLLNITKSNYYEAIIPPRIHLEDNQAEYNITPYNNAKHTLAGHFNEDDIYIIVKNKNNNAANYSITVTQSSSGSGVLLQDGLITQTPLSRVQPSVILYYNHAYDSKPNLIIKLNILGTQQMYQISQYITVSAKTDKEDNFTILNQLSVYKDQVFYKLPQIVGLITIKIDSLLAIKENNKDIQYLFDRQGNPVKQFNPWLNQYQFSFNYINRIDLEISINSKDLYLLQSQASIVDEIFGLNQKFYESFISQEGKLGVQISNCQGDLTFDFQQNYDEFVKGHYQASKIIPSGQTQDIILNVYPGPIFFRANANSTVYKLNTRFFQTNTNVPYGSVISGGDGAVHYNFPQADPDKIIITFKPLRCISCNLQIESHSKVEYKISWGSSQEYASLIGLCSFASYQSLHENQSTLHGQVTISEFYLNKTDEIKFEIDVSKQSINNFLFISVVGILMEYNEQSFGDYEIYYHVQEIALPKNVFFMYKHKYNEFIIAISILSVFTLSIFCCLCHFYRKVKKLKNQKLNLELQNRMHEAKLPDKNYGQLEEEKDDEQPKEEQT